MLQRLFLGQVGVNEFCRRQTKQSGRIGGVRETRVRLVVLLRVLGGFEQVLVAQNDLIKLSFRARERNLANRNCFWQQRVCVTIPMTVRRNGLRGKPVLFRICRDTVHFRGLLVDSK